jgi:hypothetical protein
MSAARAGNEKIASLRYLDFENGQNLGIFGSTLVPEDLLV